MLRFVLSSLGGIAIMEHLAPDHVELDVRLAQVFSFQSAISSSIETSARTFISSSKYS
jgi:hypothetical protein